MQSKMPSQQCVGFLCNQLYVLAKGWLACLQAVVATALLIPEITKFTLIMT